MARPLKDMPLYPSEAEIAEAILGPGRVRDWKAMATVWERSGMPRIDSLTGGRYWPAVKAWLDRRNGVHHTVTPSVPDGPERWEDDRPRNARPKANATKERAY